jgi:hypothetical protein
VIYQHYCTTLLYIMQILDFVAVSYLCLHQEWIRCNSTCCDTPNMLSFISRSAQHVIIILTHQHLLFQVDDGNECNLLHIKHVSHRSTCTISDTPVLLSFVNSSKYNICMQKFTNSSACCTTNSHIACSSSSYC